MCDTYIYIYNVMLTTHLLLAPCFKWVGIVPLSTLCAWRGMSCTDLYLYLCYHKERWYSVEYQRSISFTRRFNNTKSNFYFPNFRTGPNRDKNTHAQCRDAKYFCTLRPVMSAVNSNSTSCCNASAYCFVQTWVKVLMLHVSTRRDHLQDHVRLHCVSENMNNVKAAHSVLFSDLASRVFYSYL